MFEDKIFYKNNSSLVLFALTFFLAIIMFSGAVSATDLTVNPGDSIQTAVNTASDNDRIIVNDDNGTAYTYNGNIVINKNLTLMSSGGNVTVQALDSNNNVFTISNLGSGSTIQGFNINGGLYGVYLDSANNCTITDNTISGNSYDGIHLNNSDNNTISGNTISNNSNGIYLESSSSNNTISTNNISDNWCDGIYIYNSPENTLSNNTLLNNWYNFEVSGDNASDYVENINSSNTINGDPIYYLVGQNNLVFDQISMGYLAFVSCDNIELTNNTITYGQAILLNTVNSTIENCNFNENAVYLWNSSNNTISGASAKGISLETSDNNIISENTVKGISLLNSIYNTITGNQVSGGGGGPMVMAAGEPTTMTVSANLTTNFSTNNTNFNGIQLDNSTSNQITENTLTDGGINLNNSSTNTISGNILTNRGINLENSPENTVNNNTITYCDNGIYLDYSPNNTISHNNISNDYNYGIYINYSTGNTLTTNSLTDNWYNFGIFGNTVEDYTQNIDTSNIINNKPIYYLIEQQGLTFNGTLMGYLALISCDNITVNNTNITNNYNGIFLFNTNNSLIENCTLTNNNNGIYTENSTYNTFSENNINNTVNGIYLENSTNNTINKNTFTYDGNGTYISSIGIYLDNSPQNTITENTINNNSSNGIFLENSNNNLIHNNTIDDGYNNCFSSGTNGIYLDNSSQNTISGNTAKYCYSNGIDLESSSNNNISENNLYGNNTGIYLNNSTDNTISNTQMTNNINGIVLSNSSENTISGNTINGNVDHYYKQDLYGLYLENSSNNTINENQITNSNDGIYLKSANYNSISKNTLNDNNNAISLESSSNNTISENNINDTIYNVTSDYTGKGINLVNSSNNTITGNNINNTIEEAILGNNISKGIVLENSPENTISNNHVSNKYYHGISINNSPGNTLTNNILTENICNFYITGNINEDYTQNIDTSNIINDKPFYYFADQDGISINNIQLGYLALILCNNITVRNVDISHNNIGIFLLNTTNSLIEDCSISECGNGIYLETSNGNTINGNTINDNYNDGICVDGGSASILANSVTNNSGIGVYVNNSDVIIKGNDLTGNVYGIYLSNSSANVNFNKIFGNNHYGLYNTGNGTVDATNNWWGSNNGPTISSNLGSDIYIEGGAVIYSPYLILKITSNPITTTDSSTIIADLTHNNANNDTSPQGYVPDNIPIRFITNLGNITTTVNTRNGKASATFSRGTSTSGTANITATLDNQTVQTIVIFNETPLTIIVDPSGGLFKTAQTVTLTTIDPNNNITTYYTTDGSDPKTNGVIYLNPITIDTTTTLKYIAADHDNNYGPEYTQNYTIDFIPPTVTVAIPGGIYNTSKNVSLTATDNIDSNPVIYYTLDGSDPQANGLVYSNPITINTTTILKYIAVDAATNWSSIYTQNYIIDTTSPTVTVDVLGGVYNSAKTVDLTVSDETDPDPTLYYTVDGSDPQTNGIVYSNPITIDTTTTLKYIAVDAAINWSSEYTQNYIIDTIPPTLTVNVQGGVYDTTKTIILTATDNYDQNPVIYYTTNGTDPTSSSSIYTDPIILQINSTRTLTTIKFMARDQAGNQGQIQTEKYDITLPVVDINTNYCFSTIQNAIDNVSTNDGDVIEIYSGTYTENVLVNKKLTLRSVSGDNVVIQAANPSQPTITINSNGSGSILEYLTLNGNINLNADDCVIYGNSITGNGSPGIVATNSSSNIILYNTITSVGYNGIHSNASSNTIYGNTIDDCESGIYSENSNNNIKSNVLINNHYGIWTNNSTDTIQFNRIAGNDYGLKNEIGAVNATNNWWGVNTPVVSSTSPSDIYIISGTVTYDPYLVLSVNASSTNSGGNTSVTADLTHNNQGVDTSSQGLVPDGIPVNFTASMGTIASTAYTIKGQAATILNLNSLESQSVTVSSSLDNQTVTTTGIISTGSAVLNITSTAIDNSTGQPLNITYDIPLNESVTWLSIIWMPTTISGISASADELQVIINGDTVLDKFIYNDNGYNIDTVTFNLDYPGVSGFNISVTDPTDNHVIDHNFPGNVITRTDFISYKGTPYDGLHSFAIATADVTPDMVNYWLNQTSIYQNQSNFTYAAFTSFLTPLIAIGTHDQIADNYKDTYNVTWSRTSPVIVSVCDDAYESYLTLDCDHSMGMTVVGTPGNVRSFNYFTSLLISPIEYEVMGSVVNASGKEPYQSFNMDNSFGSVTLDLIINYKSDNSSVESFTDNGYFIVKNVSNDSVFLVFDLETGIWRDINTVNNFCGAYNPIKDIWVDIIPIASSYIDYWRTPPTTLDYGPFDFYWDGTSEVYVAGGLWSVANHYPSFDPLIRTDGALIIEINGTIMGPFGDSNNRNFFLHDYNINKYLHSGDHNILKVSVYSTYNVIGNYFIWLTQKGVRLEDGKADRLFPTATKCYNDLTNNIRNITSNPPNNPFPFPPSDIPLDPNDINNFFKDHNGVPGPYEGNDIPLPNGYPPELTPKQQEQLIYGLGIIVTIIIIAAGSMSGATS